MRARREPRVGVRSFRAAARGERGSVTLVVAAALGFGAILSAFAADVSRASAARARVQVAADAAALAAAQELVVRTGRAPADVAAEYAERHGATLASCRCDADGTDVEVAVTMQVVLPLIAQVRTVRAVARAVVETPSGGERLRPWFAARLACLFGRVPGLRIVSGFRTRAEQARLYLERPGLAAPPGRSPHERGLAADLAFGSAAAERTAHAAAGGCGLAFPVRGEPWHVEPIA